MAKQASPWIGRLMGLGMILAGGWLISVGLDARAQGVGGAENEYGFVRAEIVGAVESARNDGYFAPVYEIETGDGETVRCEGASYGSGRPSAGRGVRLAMRKDAPAARCDILYGAGGISSAWLILAVGAAFTLMGAAFVIVPPKHIGGGGGPL